VLLAVIAIATGVLGCERAASERAAGEEIAATGPEPEAVPSRLGPSELRSSPGQDEMTEFELSPVDIAWAPMLNGSTSSAAAGIVPHLDAEALALVLGAETVVGKALPDTRAALDALKAYVDENSPEAKRIGKQLRAIHEASDDDYIERWREIARQRFADERRNWRDTFARFELHATDQEIIELNALMKLLTQPMRPPAQED